MAGVAKFGPNPVFGQIVKQKGTITGVSPDAPFVGSIPWVPACFLRRIMVRDTTPGATIPSAIELFEKDPAVADEFDRAYYNDEVPPDGKGLDDFLTDIPYAEEDRQPRLWIRITPGPGASTSSRYKLRFDGVIAKEAPRPAEYRTER